MFATSFICLKCLHMYVCACACVGIRGPTVPPLWRHAKCMCIVCALLIGPLVASHTSHTAVIDLFGLSYTRVKLTINGVKLISHCLPGPCSGPTCPQLCRQPCFSHFPANLCDLMRRQPSVACLPRSGASCLVLSLSLSFCALFINK